jgi:hypothetical protein
MARAATRDVDKIRFIARPPLFEFPESNDRLQTALPLADARGRVNGTQAPKKCSRKRRSQAKELVEKHRKHNGHG